MDVIKNKFEAVINSGVGGKGMGFQHILSCFIYFLKT